MKIRGDMKNEAKSVKSVKKEGMRNLLAPPRAHIIDGEARRRRAPRRGAIQIPN